jgi:hypothetical protein
METMKLILIAACVCLFIFSPCSAQTEEDIEWVNKHFRSVMVELLPIEEGTNTYVGFRAHRDLHNNILEYSLMLNLNYPADKVEGVVRVADAVTLYDQLMILHCRSPAEPIENLKKQLKVREFRISEAECPALRAAFRKFSKIPFHAPDPYLLILHPMVYEFEVSPLSEHMRLVVADGNHPLVKWALNTRRVLDTCEARSSRERQGKR